MHTGSCANARSRSCGCTGCGGSLHAWPGYLSAAQPEQAQSREHLRELAGAAWTGATGRRTRRRPTLRKARAAVEGACADIVDWLAQQITDPPATMTAASSQLCAGVGELLAGPVLQAIDQALSESARAETRRALADHFFCGLLAEFCHAIDQLGDAFENALDAVVSAIIESRSANRRSPVDELVVRAAVSAFNTGLRKVVSRLSVVGRLEDVQRAARVMAILMCSEPENHREVMQYCLNPLESPIISDLVQQQLLMALPKWMTPRR